MPKLELFHIAPSRSSSVHWMLEELGEPFELVLVDPGGTRTPDYLAINPMGKVPALRYGDMIMAEAPAICAWLADEFPKAGLAPPVGDPRRGPYFQWLVFSTAALEPPLVEGLINRPPPGGPPNVMGWGDKAQVLAAVEKALQPGPYLLGEQFTAADVMIGAELIWGIGIGQVKDRPILQAYADRLQARPAWKRVFAKDSELARRQGRG